MALFKLRYIFKKGIFFGKYEIFYGIRFGQYFLRVFTSVGSWAG